MRGFDPATNRFKYEVNQRFGDTRLTRTSIRSPFFITLEARVQLGSLFVHQAVDQALAPGRTRGSERLTAAQLKQRALQSVFNPIAQLLLVKDSLSIVTKEQVDRLTAIQRRMAARQDSIWDPVVEFLANQPKDYDKRTVLDRVYAAQLATFDGIVDAMHEIKDVLSAEQIRELPPFMLLAFDEKTLKTIRPTMSFFPVF